MKLHFYVTLLLFLSFVPVFAQSQLQALQGYKIVLLPYNYDTPTNYVEQELKRTGLKVYRLEAAIKQDYDFKQDPGLAIVCNLEKSYKAPNTALRIQLVNAREEMLFEHVADTRLKPAKGENLEEDEQWVVQELMQPFKNFKHRFDERYSLMQLTQNATIKVEQTGETETSLKGYFSNRSFDPLEGIYVSNQNSKLPFYELAIKKYKNTYKAIVLKSELKHWLPGEVKAIFEPSRKQGFYNVKWFMGNKTMQYTFANIEDQIGFYVAFKSGESGQQTVSRFRKTYPVKPINPAPKTIAKGKHSSGSGFFIDKKGLIATNHHVVGSSKKIRVKVLRATGTVTYNAQIVTSDPQHDVSILKVTDTTFRPLEDLPYRFENYVEIGEPVFTIGYPLNAVMGQNYKVNDGIISAATGAQDDLRFYQISVPLQPGNSGGPLFNKMGNLIGITTAKLDQKSVGIAVENVNYALKINYLENLIDNLKEPVTFKTGDILRDKNLQNQVKVLKNFVCLIEAY